MSVDLKTIAKRNLELFGGEPEVARYERDRDGEWVDILACTDRPVRGVTSWGTIGASRFDNDTTIGDKQLRVEIVAACAARIEQFPNIISTCVFNIDSGDHNIVPEAIHPRAVELYLPDVTMKHILFVPMFVWDARIEPEESDDTVVAWLQAVPISDAEFAFARENSVDALQAEFERVQIDVFDIDRPSAVG